MSRINDKHFNCGTCGNSHTRGQHERYGVKCCPFCGQPPIYLKWHGAPRMIHCDYDGCYVSPSVTGSSRAQVV